jgi:sodium/bile acid cotransporter 7
MSLSSSFKNQFLPGGLLLAIGFGLFWPGPGVWSSKLELWGMSATAINVIAIFLVTGYGIKRGDIPRNRAFFLALSVCALIGMVGGPLVASGIGWLFAAGGGFFLGLMVMSSVPTTLSSAVVITRSAGGNATWAVAMTVLLNLTGVFVVPFTLGLSLQAGGDVSISPLPVLQKIFCLVVLPLIAGYLLQQILKSRSHPVVSYIPSACVIWFVWIKISGQSGALRALPFTDFLVFAGAAISVHLILMAVAALAGKFLSLERPEAISTVFIASQKTLPIALTVLFALPAEMVAKAGGGTATIVCVIFHFSQIILDSTFAGILASRKHPS